MLRLLSVVLPLLLALPASAQFAAKSGGNVKASLVAADTAIRPGQPLLVALRLEHAPHWHTYWLNPGTGLPTTLKWDLPAGWTAGPIQWPAPIPLKDRTGAVIGQGYEGETLLPVSLVPPAGLAPGTTVTLKAAADWLECEAICVPGGAEVSLALPVAAAEAAVPPDSRWGAPLRAVIAGLPRTDPGWNLAAARAGTKITLTVTPAASGAAGGHAPVGLHFFTADNLVGYDLAQTAAPDGRGGYVVALTAVPDAPAAAPRLVGVLTAQNGWRADGTLRALAVDVPFAGPLATVPGAAAAPAAPASSLPATLALALLGGLILNLMPCVFPVLGIKIVGFVNQSGHQRAKVVGHGLVFTLGVLLSFWTLAGVLAVLRAGGDQLGGGVQLQSPVFVYVLAVLLLVFGLNLSGLFEFGLGATAVGSDLQQKSGYSGPFFTGVLATVVATPCSAPFLAPALGAALAVSTVESFAIFTAIAAGLSAPYLLLSIFPGAVKILPRPGAWMETFKQFMAFPLYGTVGYLLWVLAAQTSDDGFLYALLSLVLVALAVWIYGRWTAPGAKPGRVRFGVTGLVVVGAAGLWLGWPRPVAAGPSAAGDGPPAVVWEPWSPEAVERLRTEGRPIYVDFTARWCATCQTNKKLVFGSDAVLRTFAAKKIATLRADWTNRDPRITAELARFGRSAVPFNLVYLPGQPEPRILPELLTAGTVLEAVGGESRR